MISSFDLSGASDYTCYAIVESYDGKIRKFKMTIPASQINQIDLKREFMRCMDESQVKSIEITES